MFGFSVEKGMWYITKVVLLGISVSASKKKIDLSYSLLSVCEYLLSKTIDIDYEYSNLIMSFISVRLFVQKSKYSDEKVGGPGETQ